MNRTPRTTPYDRLPANTLSSALALHRREKLKESWTDLGNGATARLDTRKDGQHIVMTALNGDKSPQTNRTVALRLSRFYPLIGFFHVGWK